MKNSTWKPFCSATLAVAMLLYGPGIAGAENAATQSESTQKTDSDKQQQQEQAANQQAKQENTASSAAAPASEAKVPVAEVEVTEEKEKSADKPKNKLTIGQQPDAEGVKNYVITQSSTGSKSDVANKDLPQSITVIGQKIMKEQNNKTVADALANVAGVTVAQPVPNYWYNTTFNIRGFGNGFSPDNVFVNGLWDPCISMSGWVGNLDRIEVLKGPASVLYGNGMPGGSINYVTKKPLSEQTYTIGTEFGSWGSKSTDLDMSIPLTDDKKWLSRTIIQNADNHSFQRGDAEFKRFDGSVIVQGQPRKDTTYTFEIQYHDHNGPSSIGLLPLTGTINPPYKLVPYDGNYYSPDKKLHYIGRSISAQVDHQFNDVWSIRSALRYSSESTDFYSQGGSTLNLSNLTVSQLWQHRLMRTDIYAWDTTANAKFSAWGLKHNLTLGFDWAQFNQSIPYYYRGNLPSVSLYDPVFSSSLPTRIMKPMSNYNSWSNRYGSYLSDTMELSPKFKVSTGVSFTTLESSGGHDDSGKDWRVGATYEATPGVTLFTGYSTSYEPQGTKTSGTQTVYFKPETGNQIEGGLKVDLSNRASVTLATYRINRENMVYAIPGTDPQEYEQIGKQTSKGFDLDASYVLRPGWNLLVAYSHCDAQVVKDSTYSSGSVLPNVPLNSFKIWSTYEIQEGPRKGLGFGGGLTHVGSRAVDYDNSLGWMGGYTTVDAEIHYKTKEWRYSLNLYNLTDRKYWALGSANGVYAGIPRSVTLRVERSF